MKTRPDREAQVAIALDQLPKGSRLSEIAAIVGARPSTVQRVLGTLVAQGLVERTGTGRPRYRLSAEHPAGKSFLLFAQRRVPVEEAMDLVLRANPSVEFAARDEDGYLVVSRRLSDPRHEVVVRRALDAIGAERSDARPVVFFSGEQVERPDEGPALRARAEQATVIRGEVDRSFRTRRRRASGRPLGGLHPALRAPSARALRDLARRHRLARLLVFGSAVTDAFDASCDVDVLVEAKPGARLGLDDVVDLRERLEALFDRDVDLVTSAAVRPRVRERAEREGVRLA